MAPLSQSARDRLRVQLRRERELAARVLSARSQLAAETTKRDCAIAAWEDSVAKRRSALAAVLADFIDQAGVTIERAAIVIDQPATDIARLVREGRAARRRPDGEDRAAGSSS